MRKNIIQGFQGREALHIKAIIMGLGSNVRAGQFASASNACAP
jgi:hypothetical protein